MGGGGHFLLGSLVQSRCGEGRCCKQTTLACACSASATLGLPPAHGPHFSGSRLLHEEPSEAGPGLHAPPRSEPLRFRHSGSLQRHRLRWACVLCPFQVQAAQVTRYLVSAVTPSWRLRLIASPIPVTRFSGYTMGAPSQVCHVSLLRN